MFDSNKKESKNIKIKIKKYNENYLELKIKPSLKWMNSKIRKFPITLDPSIETISPDFIAFKSSYNQALIDKQGKGRVGYISSLSNELTIEVNLEGTMNELERRNATNYEVLLILPYEKRITQETSVYLLKNGFINSKCQLNKEKVLTFDITNIVKQLYLGSYRLTTLTLSHTSSSLNGNDYIDILVKEASLILNYEDDEQYHTKKEFIQEAGITYLDLCKGSFIHKKEICKINHNALSVSLDLILNSSLLNANNHMTKGWKTSLHQYLKKTGEFIDALKTYTIKYIDGEGLTHLLIERWYYEENDEKNM